MKEDVFAVNTRYDIHANAQISIHVTSEQWCRSAVHGVQN